MRIFLMIAIAAALFTGCQLKSNQDASNIKSLQKTVGSEQLIRTFEQLTPPPMGKDRLNLPDDQMITWIKQVDDWTHKVLSSPVTGEMNEPARQQMQAHLTQVYTPEMASKLIDYFYRRNPQIGTYQANSTKAMLNLRSEWGQYELKKLNPAPNQYHISLTGRTKQDYSETVMQHESTYNVQGDRLIISEFKSSTF